MATKKTADEILRKKRRSQQGAKRLSDLTVIALVILAGMLFGLELYALHLGVDGLYFSFTAGGLGTIIGILGGIKIGNILNGRKR